jgi:hypothetical protein
MNILADTTGTSLGGKIGGEGLGPFAKMDLTTGTSALVAVTKGVSSVIGVMTVAAGIWFIFQVIIGGFFWITSGGDKQRLHEARERITNAIIGLVIVVAGWSLLALAGQFFGWDILIANPGTIIEQLGIH